MPSSRPPQPAKGRAPFFRVGQLVQHRSYDYRGVVVSWDDQCRASKDWYSSNRTRPDRRQPWYHVLVHNSDGVTYAAQTSLLSDDSMEKVEHLMVPLFFYGMRDGRYLRNDQPWPPSGS